MGENLTNQTLLVRVSDEGLKAILTGVHNIKPVGWIPDEQNSFQAVYKRTKQVDEIISEHIDAYCALRTEDHDPSEQEVAYAYLVARSKDVLGQQYAA